MTPPNLGPTFTQFTLALSEWLDPFLIAEFIDPIREAYASGYDLVLVADEIAEKIAEAHPKGSKMHEAARLRDLCDLPPIEAEDA